MYQVRRFAFERFDLILELCTLFFKLGDFVLQFTWLFLRFPQFFNCLVISLELLLQFFVHLVSLFYICIIEKDLA